MAAVNNHDAIEILRLHSQCIMKKSVCLGNCRECGFYVNSVAIVGACEVAIEAIETLEERS